MPTFVIPPRSPDHKFIEKMKQKDLMNILKERYYRMKNDVKKNEEFENFTGHLNFCVKK